MALGATKSGRLAAVGGLDNVVSVYRVDAIEDPTTMATMPSTADTHSSADDLESHPSCSDSTGILGGDLGTGSSSIKDRKKLSFLFQSSSNKSASESFQMSNLLNTPACRAFKGHSAYISGLEFPTNETLLSSSGDMSIALWDLNKGVRVREYLDRSVGDVGSLCLHPTNPNVFVSSSLKTLKVWDIRVKSSLQSFSTSNGFVNVVKMFPDGNAIAAGANDCRIYDLRSDCQIAHFENPRHSSNSKYYNRYNTKCSSKYGSKYDCPISPPNFTDSKATESMIALLEGNEDEREAEAHGVEELSFSPSGRILFTAYQNGTWGAWDVLKGQYLGNLPQTGGKDIRETKAATTFPLHSINGNGSSGSKHKNSKGNVTSIQITSDGSRLYTSNWDRMIRGYSVNSMV